MDKHIANTNEYMRIGEIAKKADVTVRTLQYYDKEGLLAPSAQSEGGYRLYSEKDMAKLVQILMMKELGFPLNEIKKRLTSLDNKTDVENILTEQAAHIRDKVKILLESLDAIEALKEEIIQMDTIDFKKYTAILINLQMKNKNSWMIKHFEGDVLDKLAESMDKEAAKSIINKTNDLYDEAAKLQKKGVLPESKKGQEFAKKFWTLLLEITGGDLELMQKLYNNSAEDLASDKTNGNNFMELHHFIRPAINIYIEKQSKGAVIND